MNARNTRARTVGTSSKPSLHVDWCSYEAAKYAVMTWHYSQAMPAAKLAKFGVWEDGVFVGAIIYGRGATPKAFEQFQCDQTTACELVRVALGKHRTPVSRIVAITVRMLKKAFPRIEIVTSYADPVQNHTGGIYQAMNWLYLGTTVSTPVYVINGERLHGRSVHTKYGTKKPYQHCRVFEPGKHKYVLPLTDEMRSRLAPLARPYPESPRVVGVDSDTLAFHAREGGAMPTTTLPEAES